jgi:hypothetical protein
MSLHARMHNHAVNAFARGKPVNAMLRVCRPTKSRFQTGSTPTARDYS